jgi:hypothetical protein
MAQREGLLMLHVKRGGWLLAMGAAAVVGCALDAQAVTLTLRAVADTTIYNDNTTGDEQRRRAARRDPV